MENLHFKITIPASAAKVWASLWEDKNYREWTSVFAPDSRADTDWKKGSKVLFLDGKNDGLTSVIEKNIPNEYMSIKHLGTVLKGVEYFDRPEDQAWKGAFEDYRLTSVNGKTELSVELESTGMDPKMLEMFKDMWPKALEKLKVIAERE